MKTILFYQKIVLSSFLPHNSLEKKAILVIFNIKFFLDPISNHKMLDFLWTILIGTRIIKLIEKFRTPFIDKHVPQNERNSKDDNLLESAQLFIQCIWREEYQKYVENHKTSIANIIKSHHGKNTLTWENRGIIIQNIIEDMEKEENTQKSEIPKYMNKSLIYLLLYCKRDDLSDLMELDKKKIIFERKE